MSVKISTREDIHYYYQNILYLSLNNLPTPFITFIQTSLIFNYTIILIISQFFNNKPNMSNNKYLSSIYLSSIYSSSFYSQ